MKLFEEYPTLQNDIVILRKMEKSDAEALRQFTANERIYRYLPTFLYEQKYADVKEVLKKMDEECFQTGESILLGVYPVSDPQKFVGIAEIYNYEEGKNKASIGCRLDESVWGLGYGTAVVGLLKEYLFEEIGLRTITAHIMQENTASAKMVIKNGFFNKYPNQAEDWGFEEPVMTDKYVCKQEIR